MDTNPESPVCEVCGNPATVATLRSMHRFVDLDTGGLVMQPHGGYAFTCAAHEIETDIIDMGPLQPIKVPWSELANE